MCWDCRDERVRSRLLLSENGAERVGRLKRPEIWSVGLRLVLMRRKQSPFCIRSTHRRRTCDVVQYRSSPVRVRGHVGIEGLPVSGKVPSDLFVRWGTSITTPEIEGDHVCSFERPTRNVSGLIGSVDRLALAGGLGGAPVRPRNGGHVGCLRGFAHADVGRGRNPRAADAAERTQRLTPCRTSEKRAPQPPLTLAPW